MTDVHAQNELGDLHSKLAASLEEMSSTMMEIEAQTKSNASNAIDASKLANATRHTVGGQLAEIRHLNEVMHAIQKSSQQITRINKVIDEIAFQTNILALNAAVEAARAGEAGAGFAVVADEVRNLAGRAGEAAKQTSELIEHSILAVAQRCGSGSASSGSRSPESTSNAQQVDGIVEQIARASSEQSQAHFCPDAGNLRPGLHCHEFGRRSSSGFGPDFDIIFRTRVLLEPPLGQVSVRLGLESRHSSPWRKLETTAY